MQNALLSGKTPEEVIQQQIAQGKQEWTNAELAELFSTSAKRVSSEASKIRGSKKRATNWQGFIPLDDGKWKRA